MGLYNGIFPIRARPAGPQLRLDFECWISHCRVMSAEARGHLQPLPVAVTSPVPGQTRGHKLLHTPHDPAQGTHRCCPFLCRRWNSNRSLGPGWQRGSCGKGASAADSELCGVTRETFPGSP